MAKRPTPFTVNAALHAAGLPYEIVRNKLGGCYYWFAGTSVESCSDIPSLYQYRLDGWILDSLVEYVREHHERWVEEKAIYGLAENTTLRRQQEAR